MVIYAKVQMTQNRPQMPDCAIISPSTTACLGGRMGRGWKEKKNKMD